MEMIVALKGVNFTMVACDTILSQPQFLFIVKNDLIKYHSIQDNFLLVTTGSYADARVLVKFIKAAMDLHRMQYAKEFTHHELVCKIRMILNEHFTWEPLQVIATYYNENEGAQIKVIEADKDVQSFDYVGLGMLGSEVCSSCVQPIYRPNLSEEQAYILLQNNMNTLMSRVPVNYPRVKVVVVNKTGIISKPDINGLEDVKI